MTASVHAAIDWTGQGTNDNINNSANWNGSFSSSSDLIFADGSVRDDVDFNIGNTITIESSFIMRRPLQGTGTGLFILENVRTQNSNYTLRSSATVILNENRAAGFTGLNETRTKTLSDTVTLVALQGAVGGFSAFDVNSGATLAGDAPQGSSRSAV